MNSVGSTKITCNENETRNIIDNDDDTDNNDDDDDMDNDAKRRKVSHRA